MRQLMFVLFPLYFTWKLLCSFHNDLLTNNRYLDEAPLSKTFCSVLGAL
jgi:hypothetical protein